MWEIYFFLCPFFGWIYVYIYICTWCYLLWSISSPCPLSLPNPPPYDALIDRNRGVFPKKGLVCSPRNVMPRTRGMCGFFLEASRPGKKTPLLKKIKTEIFGSGVIGLQYIEKYIAAPVPTYWFILTPLLVPTKIGIGHAHLSGTLRCPKPFLEEISNDRKSTCHFFNTTGGGSEKEKKLQNT